MTLCTSRRATGLQRWNLSVKFLQTAVVAGRFQKGLAPCACSQSMDFATSMVACGGIAPQWRLQRDAELRHADDTYTLSSTVVYLFGRPLFCRVSPTITHSKGRSMISLSRSEMPSVLRLAEQ